MNIVNFEREHVGEAMMLALSNYHEERMCVEELPEILEVPDLEEFVSNNLGVAALEGERLVGFLCCYSPWENAFGSAARGTFSPIHAHGAVQENREKIYAMMYRAAAEKWVAMGITSHAIGLYAHDEKALKAFFTYGFGARCADAVRGMEAVNCSAVAGLGYRELLKEELYQIRTMRKELSKHLGDSPCFMYSTEQEFEEWLARAEGRDTKVYVAEAEGRPIAFIEVAEDGENFITEVSDMKNICGAFCLPEYRGSGVFANLLSYVVGELCRQNIRILGVDYETFNPTANGAWNKYFTSYTCSVVRRIDECVLRQNGLV